MTLSRARRLRLINHQGEALRPGLNWSEEDLAEPRVLVDSADGQGHPGTFHFTELTVVTPGKVESPVRAPHMIMGRAGRARV